MLEALSVLYCTIPSSNGCFRCSWLSWPAYVFHMTSSPFPTHTSQCEHQWLVVVVAVSSTSALTTKYLGTVTIDLRSPREHHHDRLVSSRLVSSRLVSSLSPLAFTEPITPELERQSHMGDNNSNQVGPPRRSGSFLKIEKSWTPGVAKVAARTHLDCLVRDLHF